MNAMFYPVPQLRTVSLGTFLPGERSKVRRGTTLGRVKLEPLRVERTMHAQSTNVQQTASQQTLINPSKKELAPGACRIWGTMRTCTVSTVVNSIARLTNIGDSVLKVKRKFKMGTDGKVTRWWYVIHAEEACLQQLESEWQKVELQGNSSHATGIWRVMNRLLYLEINALYLKVKVRRPL